MKKFISIVIVIMTLGNLTGYLMDCNLMIFAVPIGLLSLFMIMWICSLDSNLKKQ